MSTGGVVDQNPVNAAYTNSKLAARDGDNDFLGQQTLNKSGSGTQIDDSQVELNALDTYTGKTANVALGAKPVWVDTNAGATNDDLTQRGEALTKKFSNVIGSGLGHKHNGNPGEGNQINANDLSNVNYKAYGAQGTDLISVTGSTKIVTTQLTGKSPSTSPATLGVVVNNPQNKIVIRQASGANEDDAYLDGSGNIIYGRLTESSGVWTLSFYSNIAGTETAFSFTAKDIRWYYQEIFNPLSTSNPPPVYDPGFYIPSDSATADVVDASATQRGLMNTVAQILAGIKTFQDGIVLQTSLTGILRAASGVISTGLVNLASEVSNILPYANGGTGANTRTGGFNSLAPATPTKGDLLVFDGTNWVKQAVGSDNQTLVADSSQTTGVKWGVGIIYRAALQALSSGDLSKTITFSSVMPSTNYRVSVSFFNSVDSSVQFQPYTITNKTTSGFTVKWNAEIETANYSLDYIAVGDL